MSIDQASSSCINEVAMMEVVVEEEMEVDLCVVCCSKVKSKKDHLNNNRELLSSNLIVFYLLRRILQVNDNEFKKSLINCGNPVEWIKLCDKCSELTRQAEKLHQKLRRIERELSCLQQLIWDKTKASINCECDRKLVERTVDLTKKSGQVWGRIRNHVANKCNSTKSSGAGGTENFINPFTEGDKLANYLITQKVSTVILPSENSNQNPNEEDDYVNILEETIEEAPLSLSPPSASPLKIKIEVKPEIDLVELQAPGPLDHQNYENLLIDNLLEKLEEVNKDDKEEGLIQENVNVEEMEVDGNGEDEKDQHNNDKVQVEEEDEDWNWEPEDDGDDEVDEDDDNEDSEVEEVDDDGSEVDDLEEMKNLNFPEKDDLGEKIPETSASRSLKRRKGKQMVEVKGPASSKKGGSKYIKKGRQYKLVRTEDGKIKCRQCDQTFASASGLNSHEREKHSKTPGAWICDICGEAFNSRDYRRKHIKRTHETGAPVKNRKMIKTEDGKYQCRHCDQIFASRDGCLAHERNKHSETPGAFICDICGRAFNSASYLRGHKFQAHKLKADGTPISPKAPKLEKDNICDLCGKGFLLPKHLRRHLRFVHEKRFNIKCTLCGSGWPSSNALKKHQLAIHPEDPSTKQLIEKEGLGIWKCPVIGCKVRFLKESSVKAHLKSLHKRDDELVEGLDLEGADAGVILEDPLLKVTCPTCGKTCLNKFRLRSHVKLVHENKGKPKDFICEICGGGFVSREYLGLHVNKVHLKKGVKTSKDFKCEICGKGYTHNYMLKGHMEIHEGKRDHFCDKCGHDFMTEQHLKNHKRRTNCGVEGKQARVYIRKGE